MHIALEEAKVKYTVWEFETKGPGSKPEWYYQINSLAKVRIHVYLLNELLTLPTDSL